MIIAGFIMLIVLLLIGLAVVWSAMMLGEIDPVDTRVREKKKRKDKRRTALTNTKSPDRKGERVRSTAA